MPHSQLDYDLRDQLRRSAYDASKADLPPMNHYFVVAAAIATPCAGFLNLPFINQANPALIKYAEAQENALLKIHLDIGQVAVQEGTPVITGNRLGIDGIVVELHGNQDANYIQ